MYLPPAKHLWRIWKSRLSSRPQQRSEQSAETSQTCNNLFDVLLNCADEGEGEIILLLIVSVSFFSHRVWWRKKKYEAGTKDWINVFENVQRHVVLMKSLQHFSFSPHCFTRSMNAAFLSVSSSLPEWQGARFIRSNNRHKREHFLPQDWAHVSRAHWPGSMVNYCLHWCRERLWRFLLRSLAAFRWNRICN